MPKLHLLTPRTVVTALLVSLSIAIGQCWVVYHWLGLGPNWSPAVLIGFFVLMIGWLTLGFWAVTPPSDIRWRGMVRGVMGILAGTAVLTVGRLGAWTRVLFIATVVLLLLDVFWIPFSKWRQQ